LYDDFSRLILPLIPAAFAPVIHAHFRSGSIDFFVVFNDFFGPTILTLMTEI